MRNKIYILGMIALLLGGCYEDKGNYDYKKVNDLESITFLPEPTEITETSCNYKYRQPSLDTLRVTYTPVVTQSDVTNEDNLEFQWITSKTVNKKTVLDTLRSKELTLKFAPKKKTSYAPLFRVIDHSTGVEYYTKFNMNTVVPFVNSWFVLHGAQGERKLGVVEGINAEEDELNVVYDAYEDVWGVRRFQDATKLFYLSLDGSDYTNMITEHVFVIQPDSCAYMHPFDLVVSKRLELMMPPNVSPRPRLAYASGNGGTAGFVVDGNGHLYWTRGQGWLFLVKTDDNTKDYRVKNVFLSGSDYATIWDREHRQFMYYNMNENAMIWKDSDIHPEDESSVVLTLFDEGIFAEDEWSNQEVVYMGQGNSDISEEGTIIVGVDGQKNYMIYQLGFRGQGASFIEINKTPAMNMNLDASSQLATSIAFKDQIFYTRNSAVYLYNMASGEEIYLYDAGGPITKLQFRIAARYDSGYGTIDANKRLAVVVNNPDGTGELHELFLTSGGDVDKTLIHTGFGEIQDIVFTNPGLVRR